YLHGELCKWINNRSFISTREETKAIILSNIKYLYKLLIQ
ncbi:TetR/AcrR family transcriptional regulator, partial [Clostridium perfringens]|nr:TetR/AcrR family transcriptional regulator [Clostridium perfringens]